MVGIIALHIERERGGGGGEREGGGRERGGGEREREEFNFKSTLFNNILTRNHYNPS